MKLFRLFKAKVLVNQFRNIICEISRNFVVTEGHLSYRIILRVNRELDRWDVDENEFQIAVI